MKKHKIEAEKRLKPYSEKIEFIEKTSEDAYKLLKDKRFDFVYIDGNHSYEYAKEDIKMWSSTTKLIGGDDFCIRFSGVCQAVIEYCKENNLKIKGQGNDWWIKL